MHGQLISLAPSLPWTQLRLVPREEVCQFKPCTHARTLAPPHCVCDELCAGGKLVVLLAGHRNHAAALQEVRGGEGGRDGQKRHGRERAGGGGEGGYQGDQSDRLGGQKAREGERC